MAVSDHTRHVLYFRSGNQCAFPRCNRELVEEKAESDKHSIVGIICHIKGQKPRSARYDPNMSDEERNGVDNLVVFCPTHHKIVDDQPNEYTVERGFKILGEGTKNGSENSYLLKLQRLRSPNSIS